MLATGRNEGAQFRCKVDGRLLTSWRRFQHHWAAEHAPKTSEDIRRFRNILPRPQKISAVSHIQGRRTGPRTLETRATARTEEDGRGQR